MKNNTHECSLTNSQALKLVRHNWKVADQRFANARKRRGSLGLAIRYDEPYQGAEGEDGREDRMLSDRGSGAAVIRMLDRQPDWFIEAVTVFEALEGVEKAVVDALFQDLRPAVAARIAGVSRQHVYRVIKAVRAKLEFAHRLWKADHEGV